MEDRTCGRFDAVRRVEHRMKGTAAPYGFPEITDLAAGLKAAATAGADLLYALPAESLVG